MNDIKYFWVKFYTGATWQVVKFWTDRNVKYLKGLDWMIEHEVEKFDNKNYTLGEEIIPPSDTGH